MEYIHAKKSGNWTFLLLLFESLFDSFGKTVEKRQLLCLGRFPAQFVNAVSLHKQVPAK